jgi:ketosteroid isomerase-like protein
MSERLSGMAPVTGGTLTGPTVAAYAEEVRAGLENFFAEWVEFSHEFLEFRGAGDRFAVTSRMHGKHRLTGIETEMETAGVCHVKNGRFVRIVGYSDPEAALRAVEPRES